MERFAVKIDAERIKFLQSFNTLSAQKAELEKQLIEVVSQLDRHSGAIQAMLQMHKFVCEAVEEQERVDQMTVARDEERKRREAEENKE